MEVGWSFSGKLSFLASTLASLSSSFVMEFSIIFCFKYGMKTSFYKHFCFSTLCSRTNPVCSHMSFMCCCAHICMYSRAPSTLSKCSHSPIWAFLTCVASCSRAPAESFLVIAFSTHVPHTVYQVMIIFCVELCLLQSYVLRHQASL